MFLSRVLGRRAVVPHRLSGEQTHQHLNRLVDAGRNALRGSRENTVALHGETLAPLGGACLSVMIDHAETDHCT
jgi:hypothetical protein